MAKDRSAKCSSSFSRVYELLPIRSRWKLNQSLQFLTSSDRLGLGIRTQRLWDLPFSLFFHPLHIKHLWMESRLRFGVVELTQTFSPNLDFKATIVKRSYLQSSISKRVLSKNARNVPIYFSLGKILAKIRKSSHHYYQSS